MILKRLPAAGTFLTEGQFADIVIWQLPGRGGYESKGKGGEQGAFISFVSVELLSKVTTPKRGER